MPSNPQLELRPHGDFLPWLAASGGALAVTTYNSGKLALLSASDGALEIHLARLVRPMGVAYDAGRLAVATRDRIFVWRLASPSTTFKLAGMLITGRLDVHELAFDARGLLFANTRFNCIARPSDRVNFRRSWSPPFIAVHERVPRDCCHLNGLGLRDGRLGLVTAFGTGATAASWRGDDRFASGVLIDAKRNAVVASGLCMPHSPRWDGRAWWFCNSGEGTLCRVDVLPRSSGRASLTVDVVAALPGFTRGLGFAAGRAVVGLSRIRREHILDAPPVRERHPRLRSGLWLVDPATGRVTGALEFVRGGREVFDVVFLPQITQPALQSPPSGLESA